MATKKAPGIARKTSNARMSKKAKADAIAEAVEKALTGVGLSKRTAAVQAARDTALKVL